MAAVPHTARPDPLLEADAILTQLGRLDAAGDDLVALAEAAANLREVAALYGLNLAFPLVAHAWRDFADAVAAIYGPLPITHLP